MAFKYSVIDAESVTTGREFLLKIWEMAVAVPVGVAIVHEGIKPQTLANVFYELGWMQAYGKETLVIRVGDVEIPSDFVRTEYINYDASFEQKLTAFFQSLQKRAEYYVTFADQVERNPLLAIDYLRRAFLLTNKAGLKTRARKIQKEAGLEHRAKNSVEMHLMSFCNKPRRGY